LRQRLEPREALRVLRVEQAVLPLSSDVTRTLANDPEQLPEMTDPLSQKLFLLGQLGFLAIES